MAMEFTRNQLLIAIGAGVLIVAGFLGYLNWLNHQPPVLAKSEQRDTLTNIPEEIKLNPLRSRTSEKTAVVFIRAMRDGHCTEELSAWEKDYRRKYAESICDFEGKHPLVGWQLVDWEDRPPLRILTYRGTRLNAPGDTNTYDSVFSLTLEKRSGPWKVTKYDALY
jgi:hypothetical protein